MSFRAGQAGQKTELLDGAKCDVIDPYTDGAGVALKGRTSGTAVASGYVGEELKQSRVRSAGVSLAASGTVYNVTASALPLTAGIWELTAAVGVSDNSTTITALDAAISTTTAAMPGNDTVAVADSNGQIRMRLEIDVATGGDYSMGLPPARASLSGSATYYLVIRAIYTGSAPNAYGSIRAIRIA